MKRRQLLKTLGYASASFTLIGTGGYLWLPSGDKLDLTLAESLAKIERLQALQNQGRSLRSTGEWHPNQIFQHLAQSIDYSLSGYPQMKSAFFRSTAGPAAFALFNQKGAMKHGLDEAIPGAPPLSTDISQQIALKGLSDSLTQFAAHQGKLFPHFAYGKLTKAEYSIAHALHLNDHLQEIVVDRSDL